ncbi:hypothetical protein [Leptospira noguchii]|uniref:hypothetical protein n=1 Tax=Leptospira noguchii TaxID=28182 RepID=UPI0003285EF6|nr:hypothetical protein [Leptospira noguchii]EMS84091.1 hypothetical protein LEP1GSC073_2748 [Leptospira noguchii str. Cascata]
MIPLDSDIKEEHIVEYIVSWLRTLPQLSSIANKIQAFELLPDSPVDSALVLLSEYGKPKPETFAESYIEIVSCGKTLRSAREIAFLIYDTLRYRFQAMLPTPFPLPQGMTVDQLPPIQLKKIAAAGRIRIAGNPMNGEYRYSTTFIFS